MTVSRKNQACDRKVLRLCVILAIWMEIKKAGAIPVEGHSYPADIIQGLQRVHIRFCVNVLRERAQKSLYCLSITLYVVSVNTGTSICCSCKIKRQAWLHAAPVRMIGLIVHSVSRTLASSISCIARRRKYFSIAERCSSGKFNFGCRVNEKLTSFRSFPTCRAVMND